MAIPPRPLEHDRFAKSKRAEDIVAAEMIERWAKIFKLTIKAKDISAPQTRIIRDAETNRK